MVKFKNKVKATRKRIREVFYMFIALALIFAGLPYALHLVKSWNDIVPGNGYQRMDEDDFYQEKLGNTQAKIGIREMSPSISYGSLNNTIWATGDEQDQVIIENPGTPGITRVYWFFNWTVTELINSGRTTLRYNFTFPNQASYSVNFGFYESVYEYGRWNINIINFDWSEDDIYSDYDSYYSTTRSNASGEVNWTALELLMMKAEHGGDLRPVMFLQRSNGGLETADVVKFSFEIEKISAKAIKSITALEIAGAVIGIILIGIGIGSTSIWNPMPGSKPGWLDKKISAIGTRRRRRRRR